MCNKISNRRIIKGYWYAKYNKTYVGLIFFSRSFYDQKTSYCHLKALISIASVKKAISTHD